MFDDFGSCSTN